MVSGNGLPGKLLRQAKSFSSFFDAPVRRGALSARQRSFARLTHYHPPFTAFFHLFSGGLLTFHRRWIIIYIVK